MSDTTRSPETQPDDVKKALDQKLVTHEGTPAEAGTEAQSHMGATEENVTPVTPPMAGPGKVTGGDAADKNILPDTELTPG